MTIHIGVDLHQRFCYMTAVNASGRKLRQGQVTKIVLAHKLPTAVWALLRHGVCFDESVFARG